MDNVQVRTKSRKIRIKYELGLKKYGHTYWKYVQ